MKRPIILHGGLSEGDRVWKDSVGRTHRVHGPAVEWPDGYKAWYRHDLRWREGGWPIIEDGHIEAYQDERGVWMMSMMLREDI